jgi:hypothetical protein
VKDGEEALDGIEPGGRGRREVEGWRDKPAADDGTLVGGVIVEDCVDGLAGGNFALDCIEKADELLATMALHVPPDHGSVEDVHRREQGRRSMTFVVVSHGSCAALLHRQAELSAIEGLDLAVFIDGQDDCVSRRVDIKADDVAQPVDEFGVFGELELPDAVRLKPVRTPDALHRTDAGAGRLGCGSWNLI